MLRQCLAPVIGLALLWGIGSATAQSEYEQYVNDKLDEFCVFTEACLWYDYLTSFTGSAASGATNSHYLALDSGGEYVVIAICDQDCTDIDLALYDPNGVQVASDTMVQAYSDFSASNAEIVHEAATSGTFRLDVTIYGCNTSICYYGADIGIW